MQSACIVSRASIDFSNCRNYIITFAELSGIKQRCSGPRGEKKKKKHSRDERETLRGFEGKGKREQRVEERQCEISLRYLLLIFQRANESTIPWPRCILRKQMEYREEAIQTRRRHHPGGQSVAGERYSNGINFCRIAPSISGRNLDAQPSLRRKQREQTVLADSYNVLQPLIWISYGYLFTVPPFPPFETVFDGVIDFHGNSC